MQVPSRSGLSWAGLMALIQCRDGGTEPDRRLDGQSESPDGPISTREIDGMIPTREIDLTVDREMDGMISTREIDLTADRPRRAKKP